MKICPMCLMEYEGDEELCDECYEQVLESRDY